MQILSWHFDVASCRKSKCLRWFAAAVIIKNNLIWQKKEKPTGCCSSSHLQHQHQLRVLDVGCDVEWRLFEFAARVDVGAVFDEGVAHAVVAVLRRPMESRHLQHVFGVDVRTALKADLPKTIKKINSHEFIWSSAFRAKKFIVVSHKHSCNQ